MAVVLVAEDNPENLELVSFLLDAFGHDPLVAHDGREAVEIAREKRPDLILMDLLMPEMDGFAALAEIRRDSALAGVPVVALTALTMQGDREQVEEAGFDGFLAKPIDPASFRQDVGGFLTGASRRKGGGGQ